MKLGRDTRAVQFIALMAILLTPLAGTAGAGAPQGVLTLWNKLGSQTEIEQSEAGPNGTFLGGSFSPGMFGNGFTADYTQDNLVTFPAEVINLDAGTIEFWAKLTDYPTDLPWGRYPTFLGIEQPEIPFAWVIHLNGNDGLGNGGLCAYAGSAGTGAGTGEYGSWTYAQVLGAGHEADWHHYALVWDKRGLPGLNHSFVLYLDGVLNTQRWFERPGWPTSIEGTVKLIESWASQGSVTMDNLKMWNFAKNDFADRFQEETPLAHVADIAPSYQPFGSGYLVGGQITVQDQTGSPLAGVRVRFKITNSDQQLWVGIARTNAQGTAVAAVGVVPSGTYTVTVVRVIKSGTVYDPSQNVETSDSITIP